MTMTPEEKLAMARDDDTYAIGFQDGYEKAVQDIDLRTGGDGEYFASTLPGRGCPDAGTMICRIVDRMQERVRAETERCAMIADKQAGAAKQERLAKGRRYDPDDMIEILAEERGERIACQIIAAAIRETPHAEG